MSCSLQKAHGNQWKRTSHIKRRLKQAASSTQLSSSEIERCRATWPLRGHRSPVGTVGALHPQGHTMTGARGAGTGGTGRVRTVPGRPDAARLPCGSCRISPGQSSRLLSGSPGPPPPAYPGHGLHNVGLALALYPETDSSHFPAAQEPRRDNQEGNGVLKRKREP